MARQDIKLTDSQDIVIDSGDFKIIESDVQHVQDIINSYPGWWKQYPLLGVGIQFYNAGPQSDDLILREIKIQLDSDGYDCIRPQIIRDYKGAMNIYPNAILR